MEWASNVDIMLNCAFGDLAMMSTTIGAPPNERLDQPSVEERRALIDRIAASSQFRRSTRLRDFLLYVGGQSLKDGCPEIHEQEIGAKVFGRKTTYDRSQDNIVRVNATELRKRIELYFASEGLLEPLLLEIPRGGYKPVFYRRPAEGVQAAVAQPLLAPEILIPSLHVIESTGAAARRNYLVWVAISVALAAGCVALLVQNRALRGRLPDNTAGPAVRALWKEFVPGTQETDIVLPDASVSLSEEILGHPVSLSDYLNHTYMQVVQSPSLSPDRRADLGAVFGHNLVTLGDFHAAQQILALAPLSAPPRMTLARFYSADSLKRDSSILIGGKKSNPWVRLFDDQMNFSLDYDDRLGHTLVANHHPRPEEEAIYAAPTDLNSFTGYCVVAYLSNPSHTGNVIILAGTDSDATSAAAEFITSEESLARFRSTLHVEKFPYFEVLLKSSRVSGTSFSSEVLAYRTYPATR